MAIARSAEPHRVAAAFAYGREEIIPAMLRRLVDWLAELLPWSWGTFGYYLYRHVQTDSDHHGPQARLLVRRLCGTDALRWSEAAEVARTSLEARQRLWNEILLALPIPLLRIAPAASRSGGRWADSACGHGGVALSRHRGVRAQRVREDSRGVTPHPLVCWAIAAAGVARVQVYFSGLPRSGYDELAIIVASLSGIDAVGQKGSDGGRMPDLVVT
jgi:Protein of unknown function (DUF3050)